jgi:hypothetical protein
MYFQVFLHDRSQVTAHSTHDSFPCFTVEITSSSAFEDLIGITSRKHGKKEPQSFVHCGSFDHPDLHSLNDYKLLFLVYQLMF